MFITFTNSGLHRQNKNKNEFTNIYFDIRKFEPLITWFESFYNTSQAFRPFADDQSNLVHRFSSSMFYFSINKSIIDRKSFGNASEKGMRFDVEKYYGILVIISDSNLNL